MPSLTPGINFQPGTDQGGGQGQQDPNVSPIQSAVKLLSLRLPSVVGAQAMSPQALLEGQGSAGMAGGGMTPEAMLALLRKLMMQSGAQAPPQMQPSPSGQMPSFGGPGTPEQRPGGGSPRMPMPASAPIPKITPGEDGVQAPNFTNPGGQDDAGGRSDLTLPSAGVPNPFDISPFPSRNSDDEYHRG